MAVKRLRFESRMIGGVEVEQPEIFFEWTNLPVAHGFGLAAFAFHVEAEYREYERQGVKLGDSLLRGIRKHLDLEADELRISNFYGGLQILNEIPPLKNVGLNDEGRLYADISGAGASSDDVFDALRPGARAQVREVAERSIVLQALDVRGRPESPLASKTSIEWGSFLSGVEWDRGRALMILDGAKLYDVEVRVSPRLRPDDLPARRKKVPLDPPLSPRRSAILQAAMQLWPNGQPTNLTTKERDRAIIGQLQKEGLTAPHPRTIKRAFDAVKQDKR